MPRVVLGTSLALLLGATLALAAPGLTTGQFIPEVVEFDMAAPALPAGVAARQGFVAPPMRASKRFNLVGFSWRGDARPAIALRARADDGDWTRWTPTGGDGAQRGGRSISAPVWVGEADWVQYRASRRVADLRLHFVNTTGSATPADRLLNGLRRAAHAAVLTVSPAWGAPSRPRIHPRSEWGADQCPTRTVSYGRVKAASVHHTVTANGYSRAQAPAAILAVCRYHRNTNGWNDIGYNFVVDRFGRIWEGRAGGVDEAVMGAHAQGYNAETTGISNLGTYTSVPQTDAAIRSMARLIAWKLANHGIRRYGRTRLTSAGGETARYPAGDRRSFPRILGHQDTGATACPGQKLYYQLHDLRNRVDERRLAGAKVRMAAPLPEVVRYANDGQTFTGALADRHHEPIAGATVQLQRLRRTGWKRIDGGVTDSDGNFEAVARLRRRAILRWEFAGDREYRPHRGDGAVVAVAPRITLDADATEAVPEERVDLAGTITPHKSRGVRLVIERQTDSGRWRRTAQAELHPERGAFSARRRFRKEGLYRASVRFAGDKRHVAGVSPYVEIDVSEPFVPF
ncbi:MAG TPA: peptidoglycan recognition protein [Thermoleophilaceae bacterium]|nr:peptidoglycan recognition protein [Thermoleophilaceae bacterium]